MENICILETKTLKVYNNDITKNKNVFSGWITCYKMNTVQVKLLSIIQ